MFNKEKECRKTDLCNAQKFYESLQNILRQINELRVVLRIWPNGQSKNMKVKKILNVGRVTMQIFF